MQNFSVNQSVLISMEFLAVNCRGLSSRFACSSGSEGEAAVFAGYQAIP